ATITALVLSMMLVARAQDLLPDEGPIPPAAVSPPSTQPSEPARSPPAAPTSPSEVLPRVVVKPMKPPASVKHTRRASAAKPVPTTGAAVAKPEPAPPPDSTGASYVAMSPVAGSEIAANKVPGAVSTVTAADIARSRAVTIQEALQIGVPGV